MQLNRTIYARDESGHPICPPIRGRNGGFEGTISKADLRELIHLSEEGSHGFWLKYLHDKCGYSTFKSWYLDSDKRHAPVFLLVYLTTQFPELEAYYKSIYSNNLKYA